jgi:hypothetical protein
MAAVDPAQAAREVFLDQDFWWKRIEQRQLSAPWFESALLAVLRFLGRILRTVLEWIFKLLRSLAHLFDGASTGDSVVVWLIVAAVLGWSIWKLSPVIARWIRGRMAEPGAADPLAWQTLPEASSLFDEAGLAFRAGNHAEAIRLALLAVIARLEKQGLLRYDRTRTNREYQRELRPAGELAACFDQVARIYERVWYGRAPAGRDEAEQALRLSGSLINGEGRAAE